MPCFKGFAVSIHTPDGPLAEYSIQKQSRQNRITTYIPVPVPKLNPVTKLPEASTFAISITLLTPGAVVPYSKPAATRDDPYPHPQIVGALPNSNGRGTINPSVGPYIPLTPSPSETVAAYIHFDGRAKEEVATLLRRGVETWVNSRWVSVPDSEGGGLAEREFLFREVGLERWLNGLDLQGHNKEDAAARIRRRKERLERRRRKHSAIKQESSDDEAEGSTFKRARPVERNGILRYGESKDKPLESLPGEDDMFTTDSSEDEMPEPEAAGQIRISLFRVIASGEIKKGEYSPQFDAHDDDEMHDTNNDNGDADVDHTTGLAKPKTLDPKTISTQTVTGIDPPDKPYATFTFFYRGEKQLRKMGVLPTLEPATTKTPATTKRKSRQLDFSKLEPLKSNKGTVGFSGYRDASVKSSPFDVNGSSKKSKDPDDMESDDDDDESRKKKMPHVDDEGDIDVDTKVELSQEEVARRAALAEGVKKMQLKRGHADADAFEPENNVSPGDAAPTTEEILDNFAASKSSPPRQSASLPGSNRLNDVKSDPTDTESHRATKKHRASSASLQPLLPGAHHGNAGPATPYLNGIDTAGKTPDHALLNGVPGLGGTALHPAAAGPTSIPANPPASSAEVSAPKKDNDVTAFVGGDNGAIQDVAAQTALPDESMDDEL